MQGKKWIVLVGVVLLLGFGLGFYLPKWSQSERDLPQSTWNHPAFASPGGPPHGDAPILECWDCHGSHPAKVAPPVTEMNCFDCHEIS
ncbi:MAG: hypothetical protein ACE5K3_09800 [bacterium]